MADPKANYSQSQNQQDIKVGTLAKAMNFYLDRNLPIPDRLQIRFDKVFGEEISFGFKEKADVMTEAISNYVDEAENRNVILENLHVRAQGLKLADSSHRVSFELVMGYTQERLKAPNSPDSVAQIDEQELKEILLNCKDADYIKAKDHYLKEGSAKSYYKLGQLYESSGSEKDAFKCYQIAIEKGDERAIDDLAFLIMSAKNLSIYDDKNQMMTVEEKNKLSYDLLERPNNKDIPSNSPHPVSAKAMVGNLRVKSQ